MNGFFSLLRFEHLKAKRNFSVWLILLLPWVLSLLNMVYILYDARGHDGLYLNPWLYTVRYLFQLYVFLYPLLMGITSYSLFELEYRHSNFQRLFILPVSRNCVLGARLVFIWEVVTLSVLGAYAAFWTFSFPLFHFLPQYGFGEYDARGIMAVFFVKLYQGSLVLVYLHYLFSCLFKRFSVVLGITCLGLMFSIVAANWEYVVYSPYYYPYRAYMSLMKESISFINVGGIAGILYFLFTLPVMTFVYKKM